MNDGPAQATATVRCWAPGRVNLIGDHTDYQAGLCLPVAIDRGTTVQATLAPHGNVRCVDARAQPYAAAVAAELHDLGMAPIATTITVESDLPIGAGLSSSAALEVAIAGALCALAGLALDPREMALACQRAEHRATGVPCGVMDQLAIVCGVAGHALLLDCRTLDVTPVPIPPDLAIVVVHSGVDRALSGTEYADRRIACERVAARCGVASLRDATMPMVRDDHIARHVVSENDRVVRFVDALKVDDRGALGALMLESHASLRDDYRVSTPELDQLVAQLMGAGAWGARLTGAGFGGCVVALFDAERVPADLPVTAPSGGVQLPVV